jgi:hypothetical protein
MKDMSLGGMDYLGYTCQPSKEAAIKNAVPVSAKFRTMCSEVVALMKSVLSFFLGTNIKFSARAFISCATRVLTMRELRDRISFSRNGRGGF